MKKKKKKKKKRSFAFPCISLLSPLYNFTLISLHHNLGDGDIDFRLNSK